MEEVVISYYGDRGGNIMVAVVVIMFGDGRRVVVSYYGGRGGNQLLWRQGR
jgi:hypothetical protein